ncbi:MAG: MATE family efflux transporter [Spirochaetales bacterium]|nr:MATE family efflux transporter [Spirochaetales bacterium]
MKKSANKTIIITALPIILQYLISTSINFFDSFMVGSLGDDAVAALGIANQYYFLINLFFVGISAGCGVLIAQYFGKGKIAQVRVETGIALVITICASILFGLGAYFGSNILVKVFNASPTVAGQTQAYLRITAFSYIFQAISMSFGSASRNVKRPYIPAVAGLIAFCMNIVLNYILIFGKIGFPQMGVSGAAVATLISRVIEMAILLSILYIKKAPPAGKLSDFLAFNREYFRKTVRTVTPVLLNELGFGLGLVAYSIFFSRTMVNAIASVQIALTVQNVFITVLFGFAGAAAVIVGNEVGSGDREGAVFYSKKILKMSLISSFVMVVTLLLLVNPILRLYDISEIIRLNTQIMLISDAVVLPLRFVSLVLILGVFRGGGDFRYSLIIEIIPMWGVGVTLAILGSELLGLDLWQVYLLVKAEEVTKIIFSLQRYRSMKWIHDLTR